MLEGEAAFAPGEGAGDRFDGHITGRAFCEGVGSEQLSFADGFQIAMELFVEGEASDAGIVGLGGGFGSGFYVESSLGGGGHGGSFRGRGELDKIICEGGRYHGESASGKEGGY